MNDGGLEKNVTPAASAGLRTGPAGIEIVGPKRTRDVQKADLRRIAFIMLGLALFTLVYFAPTPDPAIDPQGQAFHLTREGKAALALFFLAATWRLSPSE
jgi:hypothetical protein